MAGHRTFWILTSLVVLASWMYSVWWNTEHYCKFICTFHPLLRSWIVPRINHELLKLQILVFILENSARIFVLSYSEYEWLGHSSSQICGPQESDSSNTVIVHLTNNHLDVNMVTCWDIRTPRPPCGLLSTLPSPLIVATLWHVNKWCLFSNHCNSLCNFFHSYINFFVGRQP